MALLSLIDRLTHAIEDGEYVIGVFLDFAKAFDTVDHGILLDKLFHYGIRGCAYNLARHMPTYISCIICGWYQPLL